MDFFLFRDDDEHVFAVCDRRLPYRSILTFTAQQQFIMKDIYLPVKNVKNSHLKYAPIFGELIANEITTESDDVDSMKTRFMLVAKASRPQWPICRMATTDLVKFQLNLRSNSSFQIVDRNENSCELIDFEGKSFLFR